MILEMVGGERDQVGAWGSPGAIGARRVRHLGGLRAQRDRSV